MSDEEILAAIAKTESGGDINAVGKSGEVGKYQFMPATIKALGGDAKRLKGNEAEQDALAKKYLADLRARYGDDKDKIISAWNAGTGGVDKAVREGGEGWRDKLPKGVNKFGAKYDTGDYLKKVTEALGPQQAPSQVAQATQPEQQQVAQAEPQAPLAPPAPKILPMGAEQTLSQAYTARLRAEAMKWMMEDAPKQEAPAAKAPEQKPQEAGGFFNSISGAASGAASALGSLGKPIADKLYPAAPTGPQGQPRDPSAVGEQGLENIIGGIGRAVAAAPAETVAGFENAVKGAGELLMPSGEEATRREGLAPGAGAKELAGHLASTGLEALRGTFGFITGPGGAIGQDVATKTMDMSDEALQARLAATEGMIDSPEDPGSTEVTRQNIRELLMMPMDKRMEKVAEFGKTGGEILTGLIPAQGIFGQAGKIIRGVGGLTRDVQAARQAAIIGAAEKATEAVKAPKAAVTPSRVAEEAAPDIAKMTPAQKVELIDQDPAARQAINDIVAENIPPKPPVEKPAAVGDIVESSTFNGKSQSAVLGPDDMMVVARTPEGQDAGFLWFTKEKTGGFTVRKIEVLPEFQRKKVASYLEDQVSQHFGPYRGATANTEMGAAYRSARGNKPKLEEAPEEMYRQMLDANMGDPDLTKAALESRGFKLPALGEQEAKAVHEVLNIPANAAPEVKAAASEVAHSVAADVGITTEAAVQAAPAISRILKAIPGGDLKSIREIIATAIKDVENPLSALRSAQGAGGEAGRINAGLLFVVSRAALGGVLGSMTGDDTGSSVRNAVYAALGAAALSPKLARIITENIARHEVRETLENVIRLHGETGAINLRFPSRGVGRKPSPNTETMGVSPEAKRVVRGVNERLEQLGLLKRSTVQSHEMTKEAARHSEFNSVEKVLSLDTAKMTADELAPAVVASKNIRDAVASDLIGLNARAKLTGDPALAEDVVTQFSLLSELSQKHTNLETALGRATNAMGITSDVSAAAKFDLNTFAKGTENFKGLMLERGKVSPAQLVEMISNLSNEAANVKLAQVASKWPPAIWNVYYGLNLLSSPLTHMRNIIGNTGALGMAVVDRGFGEILGPIFRAAGKTDTVAPGETYNLVAGIFDIVADSFRAGVPKGEGAFGIAKNSFSTGLSKFESGNKYTEMLTASAAEAAMQEGNGTLPWLIQTMSDLGRKNMGLMSSTDEFFKVLSFQGELRALAQRGAQHLKGEARLAEFQRLMDNPTIDMYHQAEAFAAENTFTKAFREDGSLGGLGKKVETVANNAYMKVVATPFFRTPMRIGEFSTVHTPILNVLAPQTWSDMAAGGVKAQLAISKVVTGTAMMGLFGYYAAHGYITGAAPADKKLRGDLEDTGWREFSFYLPGLNKYVSYANIEPVTTILGTMATFMQAAPDMNEMDVQSAFSGGVLAVSKNMLNKQWWQGLSDASDALASIYKEGNANALITWLARRTSAAIPGGAASRYINNATDPYVHEPEVSEWKRLVDIYAQNVPGWGGHNALEIVGYKPRPAAVHGITGETLMNENQWLGLVAPFRISRLKNDPVLEKLVELEGARLPKDLVPKVLGGSQNASDFKLEGNESRAIKEGVELDNEQRHRLAVLLTQELKDHNGDTLHKAMAREINDPDFSDEKGGPDGGQAYRLATIYHEFLAEASQQLRDEYPAIDIAILRRQEARDARRLPKSMEHLRRGDQHMIDQEALSRGVK